MVFFYDAPPPAPVDDDEEEKRRLAKLAEQSVPARVSAMPLGTAPDYTESMAMLQDAQGRRVMTPPDRAFSALSPVGMAETEGMAQDYLSRLQQYNATPRDERYFQPVQEPGAGPYGYPLGQLTVAEEDALIAAGRLPPIHERGSAPDQNPPPNSPGFPITMGGVEGMAVSKRPVSARSVLPDGQMLPRVEETATAGDERALARRQRGAAVAPSFGDNDATLAAIASGAQPVGQTEPDVEGTTYPVLGSVRDVLNRDFHLVQIGPGDIRVYDPRTGDWFDFNPDDWTTEGQRRRRTGGM